MNCFEGLKLGGAKKVGMKRKEDRHGGVRAERRKIQF